MNASPTAFKATWVGMKVASTFSTRLAGWFTSRLWFTPWTVPVSERAAARQEQWLRHTTPALFATGAGTYAGFTAGAGPNVLLVHGWGERAASLGAFVDPLVERGYRVVGIDLPGHGATGGGRANLYEIADAIADVAAHIGGVEAVIAHSMGGHATMIALRNGIRPRAVVLVSPSSQMHGALEKFEALLGLPARAKQGLIRSIERRFGKHIWNDLSGSHLVEGVDVPALVFHAEDDPQVSLEDSVALVDAWPSARLVKTADHGHGRILRAPEVIDQSLHFLQASHGAKREELQDAIR